ncbi:unnamed protein product, partial [Polarella glacialis]
WLTRPRTATEVPRAMSCVAEAARFGSDIQLGHVRIGASKVLLSSPTWLSVALAGLQPIVPGHTVVAPRRLGAVRFCELPEPEMLDLWRTARSTQALLEPHYGATASNWAVFDGAAAGQPLPHAHLHVVPRRPGDFAENDQVYELMERWSPLPLVPATSAAGPTEWPGDDERRPRSGEDMASEASSYRAALPAEGGAAAAFPEEQAFAKIRIPGSNVFFASETGLTVAFVNLKPLVPGHVLVTPRRVVPRIGQLTDEEFDDLFRSVRIVQALVESVHGAQASRLGIQDGKDAGQSVPHIHVHILPMPATPAVASVL